jgi:hypothetical protein
MHAAYLADDDTDSSVGRLSGKARSAISARNRQIVGGIATGCCDSYDSVATGARLSLTPKSRRCGWPMRASFCGPDGNRINASQRRHAWDAYRLLVHARTDADNAQQLAAVIQSGDAEFVAAVKC